MSNKKHKSIVKIVDREDMYGDDGLEGSLRTKREPFILPLSILKKKKNMKGDKDAAGNSNNTAQMELLRQRVQEAYHKIREKRRSLSSAYQWKRVLSRLEGLFGFEKSLLHHF